MKKKEYIKPESIVLPILTHCLMAASGQSSDPNQDEIIQGYVDDNGNGEGE